jgi:hypothetical protein
VHAIYSPTISQRTSFIRQNVLSAREQNGTGSLQAARQHLIEKDRKARAEGKATGIPAKASIALGKVLGYMFWETFQAPLDPIFMIFEIIPSTGEYVSTCLRNDIWMLQDLRDVVAQEMIKSYMMADEYHGDLLTADYDYLTENIKILKKYGSHPAEQISVTVLENNIPTRKYMSSSEYLFGTNAPINPYSFQFPIKEVSGDETGCKDNCELTCNKKYDCRDVNECKSGCEEVERIDVFNVSDCKDACEEACEAEESCEDECKSSCTMASTIKLKGCPEGEFIPAFNEVWESMKNLSTIGTWKAADWGSIWEMAKARARRRADEWIKANQITLTVGGKEGGNPQSLIKGDGLNRFLGSFNTEIKILQDMIGPVIPLFTWTLLETHIEVIGVGFGADPEILMDNACMYWYAEDGVYRACTVNQFLDYQTCIREPAQAKSAKINCDLFKDPLQTRAALDIIKERQSTVERHRKTLERAETAFVYNMELSSVNENNIEAIEKILSGINTEILRSVEENGSENDAGLPTFYHQVGTFAKRHCGGQ